MDFFKQLARPEFQDRNALLTENRQYTYRELNQLSNALAHRFQEALGKEKKVILCFDNQALHFLASIAALKAGLCQIACQSGAPLTKIKQLAQDTGAFYVFSDFAIDFSTIANDMAIHNIQFAADSVFKDQTKKTDLPSIARQGSQTALIIAGSGTTGKPKLIALNYNNLESIMQRDIQARPLSTGDIHLSFTPVEFYTAKRRNLAYLNNGASVALREKQNTNLLSLINTLSVQHLSIAISHAQEILQLYNKNSKLIDNTFSNIETVFLGGSPIPEKIRTWLNKITNNSLYIAYGTNELGECCIADSVMQKSFPDCVGKALTGITLEIVNENREKQTHNTSGELRIRTEGRGFIYQPDKARNEKAVPEHESWFYPGDNALINEEGILVLQGRCDDAIIYDGVIIYPRQIELLLEGYPGILEVAAFGVHINNNHLPAVAFTATQTIDMQNIKEHLNKELGWLAPKMLSQIEHMPKNPAGKILKRNLKDAFMRSIKNKT